MHTLGSGHISSMTWTVKERSNCSMAMELTLTRMVQYMKVTGSKVNFTVSVERFRSTHLYILVIGRMDSNKAKEPLRMLTVKFIRETSFQIYIMVTVYLRC